MPDDDAIPNTLDISYPAFYSTNVWAKYYINQKYRHGHHFVWCSEAFAEPRRPILGTPETAASSTPREIYRELLRYVKGPDKGNKKIAAQKSNFLSLAKKWLKAGDISDAQHKDLSYMIKNFETRDWRPLIYVIPQHGIATSRLTKVPQIRWASRYTAEYTIADLNESEFDVLEPVQCF